jgi:hypothetical protein
MSKKFRDSLFYFFVFVFVFGTLAMSFYASGYKLNTSWPPKFNRLLIKTGMIAVDTIPRGAVVYLDDEPQSNLSWNPLKTEYLTTATKVKNVLPGEHDLRLELEGYWPFQKKIYVSSGQTTFSEDINLFRNNTPLLLATSDNTEVQLSANRKYLYIPAENKIITLKNGQERIISGASAKSFWLKNSDKLFSSGNIYGLTAAEDANYSKLIGAATDNWFLDEDQDRLYYQGGDAIGYLNLKNKTSVLVISGRNFNTYEPRGDYLFFVSSDGTKISLNQYSLATQKIEQELNLPNVGNYKFYYDEVKPLTLYDNLNKTLYIWDPSSAKNGLKTVQDVISWQWLDDNNLLYSNTWEIYRLNLETGKSDLLTRVGEEITKLIWNSEGNYLVFSSANSLNVLDIKMNTITKIYQTNKISGAVLDAKDNILYFWAQTGTESGIFKMILQ